MSATDTSINGSQPRYQSIFCGLGRTTNAPNLSLMEMFRNLVVSNEPVNGISRIGEVKVSSRMTVNQTPRTLAFVTWKERERIFGSYFTLEDESPCPGAIIDLSNSVRFS